MVSDPFAIAGNQRFTVGMTSQRAALSRVAQQNLVITAPSSNGGIVHIKFGNSAVEATLDDFPILPGTVNTFTVTLADGYIAGVMDAGTGVLFIAVGQGA